MKQQPTRRDEGAQRTTTEVGSLVGRTVVLVDDSKTIRAAAAMACKRSIELIAVSSAAELEEVLSARRVDLLLIDVDLGDSDGYELCRDIRSGDDDPDVPIVLLWGESAPLDEERARRAGASHDVRKPFDTDHLLETIDALLGGREPPPSLGPPWPHAQGMVAPLLDEDEDTGAEEGDVDFHDLIQTHAEVIEAIIADRFGDAEQGADGVIGVEQEAEPPARRIFMFESDKALVAALRNQLAPRGYQLDATDDGNLGLALVTQEPPDLILLTIELPNVNGFALCTDLKKSPLHRSIPVIVLSSEVSKETFERHRRLRTHADDYLRKPFEFAELMRRINRLLVARAAAATPLPTAADGEANPEYSLVLRTETSLAPTEPSADAIVGDEDDDLVEFDLPISEQWLVVLWSSDPEVRGRRFNISNVGELPKDLGSERWLENLVSVGRSAMNKIVINDPRVSGWHFAIQKKDDKLVLTDLRSEHGTWVNDRRLVRAELEGGEVIRVGGTVMKFINDQYLSASLEEIIREFSEREWPSGLIKKHIIYERLEHATRASSRGSSPLSIMAIFIDDFRQLSNELGVLDHAWILEEFALLLKSKFPDREIGRNVEGGFLVILPGLTGEEAEQMADELRYAVTHREIKIRRRRVALGVSIGVLEWSAGLSIREAILHANSLAFRAQQTGGNAVARECLTNGAANEVACRAVPDAEWVLRKVLATEHRRPMVAFEVDDEQSVVERFGRDGWATWHDKLIQEVLSATRPGDLVGTWKGRYVIAALDSGRGAKRVSSRVLSWWERFEGRVEGGRSGTVSLRSAALTAEEVGSHGESALEKLAEKMLSTHRGTGDEWYARAPFPLAVVADQLSSAAKGDVAVSALRWSTEVVLRFVAVLLLAGLRRRQSARAKRRLNDLIRGATTPLDLVADSTLVRELAKLAREEDDILLRPLARLFVSRAGRRMLKAISDAHRGRAGKRKSDGRAASEMLETLVNKVTLRIDCKLFSVDEIIDFGDEGDVIYSVRRHQGPSEVFPMERVVLKHPVSRGWCAALMGGEERPVSLAPLFMTNSCGLCGRVEVFVGDRLRADPSKNDAAMKAVVSGHEERFPVTAD